MNKLQSPGEPVSFSYINRKGVEEEHQGTVEEILKDRRKLLPFSEFEFKGMDPKIYSEVASLKGAIFVNPRIMQKNSKVILRDSNEYQENFPSDLSPANAFAKLFHSSEIRRSKGFRTANACCH